ncbi:MAG: cyclodeaminase/cyclohydrolase family protein [Balneola sp.]|nr:cyclodeaminase/cyclohydrolase family protein [Balneola sp.]
MSKTLLDLTINELLDKFGAGKHKPGSGSASAMLGLISCKMTQTVIKLTIKKPKYKSFKSRFEEIKNSIQQGIENDLKNALNEDSIQFDKVYKARVERDKESDFSKKIELEDVAFDELRLSTDCGKLYTIN